jgi:hypothetical protein
MANNKADANTRDLEYTIRRMSEISTQILIDGAEGNEDKVRMGVDQLRQLRSDLHAVDKKYRSYFDTRPSKERSQIGEMLAQYDKSADFCKAWIGRYREIGTIKILLELPDGPGGVLDMSLPMVWDWRNDIIAFSDRTDKRVIKSMMARGQKRAIVVCTEHIEETQRVEGATYIDNAGEINNYFAALMTPGQLIIFDKIIEPIHEIDKEKKEQYEDFAEKIETAYERALINRNTVRAFGNMWLSQGVENLPFIAHQPSFMHLASIINNFPLVIISPGPSLDKNIIYLNRIKRNAILLAPAQSVAALKREGIVPDIVMIADPCDLLYMLEGSDMAEVKAILIGVSCHPEIYRRYHEKIISFNVNGPIDRWISDIFNDNHPLGACGSVSSMAFLLAGQMRCDPIILVGQDLAFAEGKQYSKGSIDGEVTVAFDEKTKTFNYSKVNAEFDELMKSVAGDNYGGSICTLPGYYGGTVNSKYDYAMFHDEFERIATAMKALEKPSKLLNCTEGGAFIDGFEHIPLLAAVKDLENQKNSLLDRDGLFIKVFKSVDKSDRLSRIERVLTETKSSLKTSLALAKDCTTLAQKVAKGRETKEQLSEREHELMRELKKSNFISIAIQKEISNILRMNSSATTLKQNLDISKQLYQLVQHEIQKIQPYVLNSLNQVKKSIADNYIHTKPDRV